MDLNLMEMNPNDCEEEEQVSILSLFDESSTSGQNSRLVNLQETLAENILLKRELRTKLEQIVRLRNQLRLVFQLRDSSGLNGQNSAQNGLDSACGGGTEGGTWNLKPRQEQRIDGSGDAHMEEFNRLFRNSGSYDTSIVFQEVDDAAGGNPNPTLSESLIEWVESNRSEVIEKVGTGSLMIRDLTLGGVSGWAGAYVMKKFGTAALTAIGGGLLLLQLAHHGGYIMVDWNQIYNRLEQTAQDEAADGEYEMEPGTGSSSSDWLCVKVKKVKKWALDNRHFAIGFLGGFFYKTYS